jgi:hypothetical protein
MKFIPETCAEEPRREAACQSALPLLAFDHEFGH